MDTNKKRNNEKLVMARMVQLYCKGQKHKGSAKQLCAQCDALLAYASQRINHCPHMENKTFCSKCPTQCYQLEQRQRVREVMHYAGPRMLLHNPLLVIKHMLLSTQKVQGVKEAQYHNSQEGNI